MRSCKERKECPSLSLFTASMKERRLGRQKASQGYISHFYVGGKEDTSLSLSCSYLVVYHLLFLLTPTKKKHFRDTVQTCMVLSFVTNTQLQKVCEQTPHPCKVVFLSLTECSRLSELKLKLNTCKACTRKPFCQSRQGFLQHCVCPVLFIQE